MKVNIILRAADFKIDKHQPVFAIVSDGNDVQEVVSEKDHQTVNGTCQKVWISKYQWRKLYEANQRSYPISGKLSSTSGLVIYQH